MNTKQHLSFVIRLVPSERRAHWHGDVVHIQSGRRAAIRSSRDLTQFVGEEVDLFEPPDDTEWTQLISEARSSTGEQEAEIGDAS